MRNKKKPSVMNEKNYKIRKYMRDKLRKQLSDYPNIFSEYVKKKKSHPFLRKNAFFNCMY